MADDLNIIDQSGDATVTQGAMPPMRVTDASSYESVKAGATYLDPEGKQRRKPFTVSDAKSYADVPEGETYTDPQGKQRKKPTFEGVDFTAQTLYDMASTDAEKRNALARSYGDDKVKVDEFSGEHYVEMEDGKRLKPGHGNILKRAGAEALAEAAPVAGAIGGSLIGGAAGTAGGPVGTIAGGIAGAGVGAAAGQDFNDLILSLAGVYQRTGGEEAMALGGAAAGGAVGEGVGRGAAAVYPLVKGKIGDVARGLPAMANKFLGTDPEGLATALGIKRDALAAGEDVLVPPSQIFKESPHLQNVVEVFDPAMRTQKPLLQSATGFYERKAKELLGDLGVEHEGSIVNPTAAASTEKAGTAIKARITAEVAAKDAELSNALERAKATKSAEHATTAEEHEKALTSLREAETNSRKAAQDAIDAGFQSIQEDVDAAAKATKADLSSGGLWEAAGRKLMQVRKAIGLRASKRYQQADELAEGHLPNSEGLPTIAQTFLDSLPPDFQGKYPDIVKKLRDLAGVMNEKGEWIKEPETPTFGQLHNIRSLFRSNVNYHDLTPGIRDGVYKFFAHKVDNVLHDVNAVPELKAAAEFLDATDKWYAKNISTFKDKDIQAVVNGLESGMPADANMLYQKVVKEGRSELTDKVKKLVGPTIWAAIKAADVKEMLDLAKTLVPGQIDGRVFAKQVLDRVRNGMLVSVHGKEVADRLLKQAQHIEMLGGRLEIPANSTDTVTSIIAKARLAADAAKDAAKADPLGVLGREMKTIEHEHKAELGRLARERRNDPLAFLYKESTGASEAANHILGSEDLIFAAANKFGEDSNEFKLLRQLWTQRILEGTLEPGKRLEKVSPEIQRLMLPGVTLPQMQTLAKNMDFLMGGKNMGADTARGMAAMSKIEHPWPSIIGGGVVGKILAAPTKIIPGSDVAGRGILTWYYKTVTELMNKPAFLAWLEKGLNGSPEQRDMARVEFQRRLGMVGGATGAGVGEAIEQTPDDPSVQRGTPTRDWRAERKAKMTR